MLLGSHAVCLELVGGGLFCRTLLGFGLPRLFRHLLRSGTFGCSHSRFERAQSGDQLGRQFGVMRLVRMDLCRASDIRRRLGTGLIHRPGGELVHAAIQLGGRRRHVAFGMHRGSDFRHRLHLAVLRLEHHMRHLRLGIVVAHGDDLRGQRIHVGQLRLGHIELAHHVIDHLDRLAEQVHALG